MKLVRKLRRNKTNNISSFGQPDLSFYKSSKR